MIILKTIKCDYKRYRKKRASLTHILLLSIVHSGFRAILLYRIGFYLRDKGIKILAVILEKLMHHLCFCWISTKAKIGEGFLIAHVGGIVIAKDTIIGKNCDIRQNTTFGGNYNKKNFDGRSKPIVGNNVSIGASAVIIGPVFIGDDSIVGANSVVNRDVKPNAIVFGVPARLIKYKWDNNSGRHL